ncbi:FAD binding domain-containing protein [Candidatus Dojkabacteria bacterium]|uniref:FAD binding domain-containing protein n=1 Tax=Candidatus Dojkabacteria bacterium TaxID=2099670 RepID=A0A955RIA3_9BACT|nr:FAD binding domain-containing protein [Candidatus Dojkabacteria bacterium]
MKIISTKNYKEFLQSISKVTDGFGFLAGGTNVMMDEKRGSTNISLYFDISGFDSELRFIRESEDSIEIGALMRLSEITKSTCIQQHLPHLVSAIQSIGTMQVRNMATLAGNVANASSIGDSIPALMISGAVLKAENIHGQRIISIEDFFLDYKKTALKGDEIIRSIILPKNNPKGSFGFVKVAVRPTATVSKLNLAYAVAPSSVLLAAGGVAKVPVRLYNTEAFFQLPRTDIFEAELLSVLKKDVFPINDTKSTVEYRVQVLANLLAAIKA